MGGRTDTSLRGAYAKMLNHTALWHFRGFGKWGIEEKASGEPDRARRFPRLPLTNGRVWNWAGRCCPPSGARVTPARPGAALDWGFETLGADRVLSMIQRPPMPPSINVARKLGMTYWRLWDGEDGPQQLWSLTRDTWAASRPRPGAASPPNSRDRG